MREYSPPSEGFRAMIDRVALAGSLDIVVHQQVLEDFDQMIAQLQADAIRNAADYMDIGNNYYQMLAVDDLYEKADYMDGTKP